MTDVCVGGLNPLQYYYFWWILFYPKVRISVRISSWHTTSLTIRKSLWFDYSCYSKKLTLVYILNSLECGTSGREPSLLLQTSLAFLYKIVLLCWLAQMASKAKFKTFSLVTLVSHLNVFVKDYLHVFLGLLDNINIRAAG